MSKFVNFYRERERVHCVHPTRVTNRLHLIMQESQGVMQALKDNRYKEHRFGEQCENKKLIKVLLFLCENIQLVHTNYYLILFTTFAPPGGWP